MITRFYYLAAGNEPGLAWAETATLPLTSLPVWRIVRQTIVPNGAAAQLIEETLARGLTLTQADNVAARFVRGQTTGEE